MEIPVPCPLRGNSSSSGNGIGPLIVFPLMEVPVSVRLASSDFHRPGPLVMFILSVLLIMGPDPLNRDDQIEAVGVQVGPALVDGAGHYGRISISKSLSLIEGCLNPEIAVALKTLFI